MPLNFLIINSSALVRYEGDARHRGLKGRSPALVDVLVSLDSGKGYDLYWEGTLKELAASAALSKTALSTPAFGTPPSPSFPDSSCDILQAARCSVNSTICHYHRGR